MSNKKPSLEEIGKKYGLSNSKSVKEEQSKSVPSLEEIGKKYGATGNTKDNNVGQSDSVPSLEEIGEKYTKPKIEATYTQKVEKPKTTLTYSNTVNYLKEKGVSSASNIMTKSEWQRRKGKSGGTYEDYLKSQVNSAEIKNELRKMVTPTIPTIADYKAQTASAANEASYVTTQPSVEDTKKTANLDDLQKEIDNIEATKNKAKEYEHEIKTLKNRASTIKHRGNGLKTDSSYDQKIKDTEAEYKQLLLDAGFNDIIELENKLSEKKQYKNSAKYIQDGIVLADNIRAESKFNDYVTKGEALGEEKADGWLVPDTKRKNVVAYLRNNPEAMEAYEKTVKGANGTVERLLTEGNAEYKLAKYGTKEQVENYYAYLGKGDADSAEKYLESIEESLNIAMGKEIAKGKNTTLKKLAFGTTTGADQFEQGMYNIFKGVGGDDYIPSSPTQIASGQVRESLKDSGFKILGTSIGQSAYDLITTTSNMLPSIGASYLSNAILPGSGAYVGAALMGGSAAGNSYQEKLNAGWDKKQALTYATIVGVSEAGLQYAMGGIGSLGGKVTGKSAQAIARGIDNAALRFVTTYGIKMTSEGMEEALQEVLTPFFENIALGYQKNDLSDIEWEQVVYSGMLGALSAGFLEGVSTSTEVFGENKDANKMGKHLKNSDYTSRVLEIASSSPKNSATYDLYSQYVKKGINAENISELQLGRLFINAEADVTETLSKKKIKPEQGQAALATLVELNAMKSKSYLPVGVKATDTVTDNRETSEPDSLEKAARDVVESRNKKSGKVNAEMLDKLTADNQPIYVDEVKEVTGFGDRGARVITGLANRDGITFSQAKSAVENAYQAGFSNVKEAQVNFDNKLQEEAFRAGKYDRAMQNGEAQARAKNAVVYKGEIVENEHTNKLNRKQRKVWETLAKPLGLRMEYIDKILANKVNGIEYEANARYVDGVVSRSITSERTFMEDTLEETLHRMEELATEEYNVLANALYEHAEQLGRGIESGNMHSNLFDQQKAKHDEAGLTLNTRGYMGEVVTDEVAILFKNEAEFNRWYSKVVADPQLRSAWQKFMDFLAELAEKVSRFIETIGMSKEEKAAFKKKLAEIERLRGLYANALNATAKAVQERTNELSKQSNLDNNLDNATTTETENKADKENGNKQSSVTKPKETAEEKRARQERMKEKKVAQQKKLFGLKSPEQREYLNSQYNKHRDTLENLKQGDLLVDEDGNVVAEVSSVHAETGIMIIGEHLINEIPVGFLLDDTIPGFLEMGYKFVSNKQRSESKANYSIRENFYTEFDEWVANGKKDTNIRFVIGNTSDALKSIGVKDQEIKLNSGTVIQKLNTHKEMTAELFKKIPELLENPIIVQFSDAIDEKTKKPKYDSRITVLGELYAEVYEDGKMHQKPILVSLELLPTNQKGTVVLDFSIITSAYAKDALQNYLYENSILYIEPNKKRTDKWLSLNRLQLPLGETRYGPVRSITYVGNKVKVQNPIHKSSMQAALENAGVLDEFGNSSYSLKASKGNTLTEAQQANPTKDPDIRFNLKNPDLTDNDLTEYMKTGKKLHTRNKKQRMLESGKKPILTSSVEVKNFILDVIHGRAQGEVRAFKKVGKRLADAISSKRSSLQMLGKYLELNADGLREAYKMHSSPKEKGDIPLSEKDFESIPEYLDEFDGVLSVNTYNNKIEVHIYKETADGYVKILTVASNERNSLQVTKMVGNSKEKFEQKYAKKIEGDIGSLWSLKEDSNPSTTAQHTADVPSTRSISPSEEKVKSSSNFSLKQNNNTSSKDVKALFDTIEHLKNEFEVTKFAKADSKALAKLTKQLLKEYSSQADVDETFKAIDELYQYLANGEDGHPAVWNEAYSKAYEIASRLVDKAVVLDDELYMTYKNLRDYLRKTPMKFNSEYDSVPSGYENFQDFRRRNWGRLNFTKDGIGVDGVYKELAELYPEFFNADEQLTIEDMLGRIVDVLDELQPTEINPYSSEMKQTTAFLAGDIIDRFFDIPQAKPTFADKAERRVVEAHIKAGKKVEAVRQQKDEKIKKLIESQREKTKRQLNKLREQRDARVKKEQKKRREAISKMSESQKAKVLRAQITRHASDLSKKLLRPTDNQHIPEDLRGVVATLLESINLESNYTYDTESHSYKKNDEGLPTRRTKAFEELRILYSKIKDSVVVDPDLLGEGGLLSDVILLADKRIADMNSGELETVWDAVRAIEASVNTANKIFSQGKFETILGFTEALRADNAGKEEKTELRGVWGKGKKLTTLDMLTPETYFHFLGNAGDSIFRIMRDAQDKHISIMKEVANFTRKTVKGVNVNSLEKTIHTVTLGGEKVNLTTAQLMELYVLMKRGQAVEHILVGGILPDVTEGKGAKLNTKAEPIRNISRAEIAEAISKLTDEQKKIADELQKFVSTVLADYGNEASMKVYNYEKFLEKNYWTIRTNKQEIVSDVGKDTAVTTVANKGVAKGTTPHANTSVRIGSIFDTFATHSSDMATYAAWLGTSEDVNRIRNFVFWEDGARTGTVKGILDTVHGIHGSEYLQKLLTDIAIGVKGTDNMNPFDKLIGSYKAASVGANLRVLIQQPTAILRALDMIDAKYLAEGAISPFKGWNKAKKYAPIAQWKDWGHFDINTGRQMKDVLFDNASVLEKTKQVGMWGASMADSLAWGQLWNAVEAETKTKHNELAVGSDEYYEAVAKRFTEIVDHTQVVDGILQRSQIMRSPDALTKMATSFMGEPTKQYNMAILAAYDAKTGKGDARKKAVARLGRTAMSLAVAGIVNACAQSIIDAMRDDDKEKDYWEKWLAAFKGDGEETKLINSNLGDTINPFNYVPFAKDIISIMQGYDVKRMDAEAITKTLNAVTNMYKAVTGTGKYTIAEASAQLFAEAARLYGLPVANVKRDIKSLVMSIAIESENYLMQYRMEKAMLDINYAGNSKNFMDILFNAYNNDRKAYEFIYNDLLKNGYEADKIKSGMETRMKKAEGVEKTSDLSKRYMTPATEKKYDSSIKRVKSSQVWESASTNQRKEAEADLYNFLTSTSEAMKKAREEARAFGVDETEYTLWQLAKEIVNDDKDSMNAKEKAAAIEMLDLGNSELAYFYGTETSDKAFAGGVNIENFANFKAAVSGLKGDDKKAYVDYYARQYANNTKEYLFFMGSEYSSYKKRSDYIMYFGK